MGVFFPADFLPGDDRPDCGVFRPGEPALLDLAVDFREPAVDFFSASAILNLY